MKKLIEKLNARKNVETGLFKDVDLMLQKRIAGRDDIFIPWIAEFHKTRSEKKYRYFVVKLPFREADVKMEYAGKK